ncbi:MAG: VpsR-related response regulator, partial [Noviherbaspirillum sp.]
MLSVSTSAPTAQPVLVLRLTSRSGQCSYTETLKEQGLNLIECFTLEAAHDAMKNGCRVGLLIVKHEAELMHLDKCEPFVSNNRISWVGLVAQDLIAMPRMREFIGEHLFNFITLPAELDHIVLTLRHAWGMAFMRDVQRDPSPPPRTDEADFVMVGKTAQMQRLFNQVHKVARTDASVLVVGPSGT